MNINRSVVSQKHTHRVRHYAAALDTFGFFNRLTSPDLFDAWEATLPEHRERLFPPTETLSLFRAQALKPDRSCQGNVNDVAVARLKHGLPPCRTNTGGYCRARKRLPLDMVSGMAPHTGQLIAGKVPDQGLWHGRRVRGVDGTSVTFPDTQANQDEYPQQNAQQPGRGFPICRIVGITCLFSGAVLNAAMGKFKGKETGELALLRTMRDVFEAGDVILADALYATYFFRAALLLRRVDAVFEQQGSRQHSTDFMQGEALGKQDHRITRTKPKVRPEWMTEEPYKSAPDTLTVRELKVGGKVLVTQSSQLNAQHVDL